MNLFDVVGGRQEIDPNAATNGVNIGLKLGATSAQAGPAAFALDVIKAKQAEDTRRAALTQEQFKARQSKLQGIVLEAGQIKSTIDQKIALAKQTNPNATEEQILSPQELNQYRNSSGVLDSLTKHPIYAQAMGLPPKELSSGTSFLNLGGTTNVGTDPLAGLAPLAEKYPGIAVNAKLGSGLTANIPLNAKPTEQESNAITGAVDVNTSVDKALELLSSGALRDKRGGTSIFKQMGADYGNQLLIPDNSLLESLVSEINNLKSRIPFAKGGKQLTPFESKLLFRLLDTTGKSDETIVKDLTRFKTEFNNMSKLAQGGKMSAPEMLKGNNAVTAAKKTGGQVMVDANGNRAIVYPDGTVEEI